MEYFTALNDRQREAVACTEGYLRVIAGAGSGKTKLLVSRYAYLVREYGIDPANILCVTFTNKAAGEMKRRIRAIIGEQYDTSLICTYHGFCVRVLREDVGKIFYPQDFQIIDKSAQKDILADIYQKFELKLDHAGFEKVLKQIAQKKASRVYVAKMRATVKCQVLDEINTLDDRIIEEYLQHQKQIYAMDFSDLIYFTLDIFDRCPDVLGKWQDRLNYIQVDEFQDSSSVEMELIDKLSEKYRNLMIVGDPDQNIYEWRGSDVKLLVDFDKHHVPCKTIFLNQNYRSTPQILKCANTLIDKNQFRLKKDLFTKSGDGPSVMYYHSKSDFEESERIAENIRELRRTSGCRYADFAVLYRSGFLSRVIEKKFTEEGIPYEIFGGVKFYQRMEIQDIMAYLKLIVFDDDSSFKRIINKPRRRFGRTKMQRLAALQKEGTLFQTLKENVSDPVFRNSRAEDFVELIDRLRACYHTVPLAETVSDVCGQTGYETYIRELGDMERFDNLAEFKRIAVEYEKSYGEAVTLPEFINQISLQSEDDDEKENDTVKLMTIHAAKGLEFPNVFVVGFSEGIFPSSKTIEDRKQLGLEEERRLCYVAITRAEMRLFLFDSEGIAPNGRQKLPSRFLREMGAQNYVCIGVVPDELQKESERIASGDEQEHGRQGAELGIGDSVTHHVFGNGVIVGYGINRKVYRVRFDALGSIRDISADFFQRKRSSFTVGCLNAPQDVSGTSDICTMETSGQSSSEVSSFGRFPVDGAYSGIPSSGAVPADAMPGAGPVPEAAFQDKSPTLQEAGRCRGACAENFTVEEKGNAASSLEIADKRQAPGYVAEASGQVAEASGQVAEAPGYAAEAPGQVAEASGQVAEVPGQVAEAPGQVAEVPGYAAEAPGQFENSTDGSASFTKASEICKASQKKLDKNKTSGKRRMSSAASGDFPAESEKENLWDREDVPSSGWICVGVIDLGEPSGICGMCGRQIIRYVHTMIHPAFPRSVGAGCVCAGRMEGDTERARKRERDFKNKQARRESFLNRKWRTSRNGNSYLKIKEHVIILCKSKDGSRWSFSIDRIFNERSCKTKEDCMLEAFEALDRLLYPNTENASK